MTTEEPQCDPADLFHEVDRILHLELQKRAPDALTAKEFDELTELTDRWARYCAYRGRYQEWWKRREELANRPAKTVRSDPSNSIGAQLLAMRETRDLQRSRLPTHKAKKVVPANAFVTSINRANDDRGGRGVLAAFRRMGKGE